MKIIALGDTHGRTNWEDIVSNNQFNTIVFIGDYFDTHGEVSAKQQKENFKNIISFKNSNPGKVILLFGNHDFHYLPSSNEQYSGYQYQYASDFLKLLVNALNENLIQMCFVHKNYLFSHAGVTKTWYRANNVDLTNIEGSINNLFTFYPEAFKFTSGKWHDPYGDEISQTPIWVRPKSLNGDAIEGFIQVVGHTTVAKIIPGKKIIQIDALGTSGEFLCVENGIVSILKSEA